MLHEVFIKHNVLVGIVFKSFLRSFEVLLLTPVHF